MAEKNYKTVAVVPEMPRTIDMQQLHVYTPIGSTGNFGVFKPDGEQFVITADGKLRVDASKLIQLNDPAATVVEDGGATDVEVNFTETDSTLLRKFAFVFKNIKGAIGDKGDKGLDALQSNYTWTAFSRPVVDTVGQTLYSAFNRTPVIGDTFIAVYRYLATDLKTVLGVYIINCEITEVSEMTSSCKFKITSFLQIPTNYITAITGPVTDGLEDTYTIVFSDGTTYDFVVTNGAQGPIGPTGSQGEQGPKGDDGVSITSVTQEGVQGGTLVTITLSDGQSTSFTVYNGINTEFKVVQTLPTSDISTSTIYLVPSEHPGEENIYDEYIYVNGDWEHIGSTSVDLTDYVTKTYFDQTVGTATKNYINAQVSKIQNLYIEMYESGSVPAVGQALTLTNSNFARVPATDQYFALIEVVNTKDKYYSICKIASVDTTTCSATVEAVTELDSGTEIEAIKASIEALTTTVNGKADTSALSGKLDKVTTATSVKQAYVKHADGTQEMIDLYASPVANTIVLRDGQGKAKIAAGTADDDIATVGQLNSAVSGLESTSNKKTSIVDGGNDTDYPSTKAVADYVKANAPSAYHIELSGTSSSADLTQEQIDGLVNDTDSYILNTRDGVTYKLCRNSYDGTNLIYSTVVEEIEYRVTIYTSTKRWSGTSVTLEKTSNKITFVYPDSDTSYCSSKAIYTYGQQIQTNAQTYATTAETNAKAYADEVVGNINTLLTRLDIGEGV